MRTRTPRWPVLLGVLIAALCAQSAAADDDEFGYTGTVVGGNIAVGGETRPQPPGVGNNPFVSFASPALQPLGVRVFGVPGYFGAFDEWAGNVYALRNFANGLSDVYAFTASGAPVAACDGDGVSDPFNGQFMGLFTSDEYIFLFGYTVDPDTAKLVVRLDFDCQPAGGGGFDTNGRMTVNPTTGFDLFTAGEYDTLGAIGVIALAGTEGADGEIDLFDEDGVPITGFDDDGSLTIDLTGSVSLFDLELVENGNGMLDAFDRVFFFGQHANDALLGVTNGTGAPPQGTHCGTMGTDAITQIFDISTGAVNNFGDALAVRGSTLFAGATIVTPQFELDALINTYNLSNLCDRSTTGSQSWVRVLSGVQALDSDVAELVPSGSGVYVVGSLDNPQNQSFDPFVAGLYNDVLQRGGFQIVDLTPSTPGTPGTPGGGTPGGGGNVFVPPGSGLLLGDFNGDGTVNAADYVVWRKGQVTEDYIRVRQRAVGGYERADSVVHYTEWKSNFGSSSSAQRRRPRQILFARRRLTLRGGESKVVRIPLTRAGKRQLRRYDGRRLRARLLLRVTYRPAGGGPVQRRTFRQAVRLRVVKPKRRR